ncbi:MAG: polysaccharide deacetylase family protein [Candidatus Izemoplasmatales bacterium]|nr:polysaccharide deacetylase family protein [Candidatus Izemoplasmatales bacterium]
MWQNKYLKAITFSYDDGVEQDERLVALLNKYHLKATFNVNTGFSSQTPPFVDCDVTVRHLDHEVMKRLFIGHEVAIHGHWHHDLTKLTSEEIVQEIVVCKNTITSIYGTEPVGMAYSYGAYNDFVISELKKLNVAYARTVHSTYSYEISENLLEWNPTIHHADPRMDEIVERFLSKDTTSGLLSIWGHSYEFDQYDTWNAFESLLKKLSGHSDIYYGTNQEVLLKQK